MYINAKDEFFEQVGSREVMCAEVHYRTRHCFLPVCYTDQEYKQFLDAITFSYDSGYGQQEIGGCIWYLDGTWSERAEDEGKEWWEDREIPIIPKYLHCKRA